MAPSPGIESYSEYMPYLIATHALTLITATHALQCSFLDRLPEKFTDRVEACKTAEWKDWGIINAYKDTVWRDTFEGETSQINRKAFCGGNFRGMLNQLYR